MYLNIQQMVDCNSRARIIVYSASSNDTSVGRGLYTLCFLILEMFRKHFCKLEVLYCHGYYYLGSGFIKTLSYTLCAKVVQMCYSR